MRVAPHIILDERGRPWIEGTNTKVIEVVLDYLAYSWTPEDMHRQHPHLSVAELYAAMAYYFDHKSELDAEIERQLRRIDALRSAAGESPLVRRLRLAGKIV